jgi:hypothetical protein
VTDGLQAEFGTDRVMDPPLAEAGITGVAVGLAYRGYRPVVEIQFDGFVYPAVDQLVTQLARIERLLTAKGALSDERAAAIAQKADTFAAQMREGCYGLPNPEPLSLFEDVFVEPTPELERQRSQYAAYLAMFDEEA